MDEDQRSGEEPEREEIRVDLEPIRKTYNATSKVVKLGRRWLETRPFGMVFSGMNNEWMYETYMETFSEELDNYLSLYGYSEELRGHIARTRPLFDAMLYLHQSIQGISRVMGSFNVDVESVSNLIRRLGTASKLLGEVLDELEAKENTNFQPEWYREAKQLQTAEILEESLRDATPTPTDKPDAGAVDRQRGAETNVGLRDRLELILAVFDKDNPGPFRAKRIAELAQLGYNSHLRADLSQLVTLEYLKNDGRGYTRTDKPYPCR
jgi:hypothetical protein